MGHYNCKRAVAENTRYILVTNKTLANSTNKIKGEKLFKDKIYLEFEKTSLNVGDIVKLNIYLRDVNMASLSAFFTYDTDIFVVKNKNDIMFSNELAQSGMGEWEVTWDRTSGSRMLFMSETGDTYFFRDTTLFATINLTVKKHAFNTKTELSTIMLYDSDNDIEYKDLFKYVNIIENNNTYNLISPVCTCLFNDYNYTSPVSGSPVILYGNGINKKIDGNVVNNKQFTAYTDILPSYNYTLNSKGIIKPSSGKVIAGITTSSTKPVVSKNKIVDKDAAKIAKARIKNGQVTITATGKEKGLVYLWIIDTGKNGAYECCPVNVLMAPKKLETRDISGSKLKNPAINAGSSLDVCVAGIAPDGTTTDDCTYTATVADASQSYIKVTPVQGKNGQFKITATGLKNNKDTKVSITFTCNENKKKIKLTATIKK